MQRTVVQTVGVGLRLGANFQLTGHAELDEALAVVRQSVRDD